MIYSLLEAARDGFPRLNLHAGVLAYPTREGKFVLDHGIGAVLTHLKDGMERPIAFASQTLSKSEKNDCVTRREPLAIIVEFFKQHRHYLQDTRFCIRTNALCH